MTVTKDFKGKTIEDAVMNGVAALGIDRDEIFYEVVERPRSGFLGIGKSDAIVRISYEIADAPKPKAERPAAPRTERPQPRQEQGTAAPQQRPQQPKPQPAKEQMGERKPRPELRPNTNGNKPAGQSAPRPPRQDRPERTERPAPQPAQPREAAPQKPPVFVPGNETSQKAENFLSGMFQIMGVEANMSSMVDVDNNIINIDLSGENMGFVIGRRGETLDALQYLATIYTNRSEDARWRVSLDTENYREKRNQALVALAHKTASNVARQNKSISLEPMNPQERRIIHAALQDNKAVTTFSTGAEPRRKIVVAPAGQKRGNRSIKNK